MKTVIIYVLTSPDGPYPKLAQTSLATWDSIAVDGVQTCFYSSAGPQVHPKLIHFNVGTGLFDIGHKDLAAYTWALGNCKWDYMARVAASCYVKKRTLHEYVQTLPDTGLFRGIGAHKPDGTAYLWGGTHYVISRDIVQRMVDNQTLWNHGEMEDVAMSLLVSGLGIPLDLSGRACSINKHGSDWRVFWYADRLSGGFDFTDFDEFKAKTTNQHFIRVKQDGNRETDMWLMRELFKRGNF